MTDYERGYHQGKEDAMKNWVGLTMLDMAKLRQAGLHMISDKHFKEIEAKLKEKNSYNCTDNFA